MGSCNRFAFVVLLAILLVGSLVAVAFSQGIQQSPYSGANVVRAGAFDGPDLTPSSPLGLPRGPQGLQSIYLSDGMLRGILPPIPNLQLGYLFDFGSNGVNQHRFIADYLLPVSLSADSEVFGEVHSEFQNFWNTPDSASPSSSTVTAPLVVTTTTTTTYDSSYNNRIDLSLGGGYRTFLRKDTLVGVNGFFDTSRLSGMWRSSGGVGLEMASLIGGNDALDVNFNWYGRLFDKNVILQAFRYGPSNFDLQSGYSHELWNGGPDLRLSLTGYKFDIGDSVYGWNAAAELKSRDNMFVFKYAVGHDRVDSTYHTVGGFVNIGFQPENLLRGESPFSKPEPIFSSPRSLRYVLTQKVHRNWHQPTAVALTRGSSSQTQGPGPCVNPTDRFLASLTMTPGGGNSFDSGITQFPYVSYLCLDPTKDIRLEFDFTGPGGAGSIMWSISIGNSSYTVTKGLYAVVTGMSGHFNQTFTPPNSDPFHQAVFTDVQASPAAISVLAVAVGVPPSGVSITNVAIHFNQ